MSDEAVGIAILHDPDPEPGRDESYGFLYFVARYSNGKCFIEEVPITREDKYDRIKKGCQMQHLWAYRMEGDMLHCHPSVNDLGAAWHNSYHWSVKFVPYEPAWGHRIGEKLRELNLQFLPP
jgi:hypothetical protein